MTKEQVWRLAHLPPHTIDEMVEALETAGWKRITSHVWRSPNGRFYRGPALAYHVMMGLPWPPS